VAPRVSVIIPTHNRLDVLPQVLRALEEQRSAPDFEIVVVDDGSSDGTGEWLAQHRFRRPLQVIRQANRGPAAARNAGVAAARAPRLAFLGDDTVPSQGWLKEHWQARERIGEPSTTAVIGYTSWHPRVRSTPFLEYINEYGLQFGYALIEDPDRVPFNFFYTSNLSLSREALEAEPFDLGFPYPAWEDIEVSYRLWKNRGLRLVYEPRAEVLHDHPTDLRRFMSRQEKVGYCAVVFFRRHPELGPFLGIGPDGPPPVPPRFRQRWRERLACTLQALPLRLPGLWEETLRFHYVRGLHRGWREAV
jgi:glycosyltransferase involved in cell wall biosynthesis